MREVGGGEVEGGAGGVAWLIPTERVFWPMVWLFSELIAAKRGWLFRPARIWDTDWKSTKGLVVG